MSGSDEVLNAFVVESLEGLDQLDRELIALEQTKGSKELLDEVFRVMHTIKGNSSMLGFRCLESLSDAAENLLSSLRTGEIQLNADITSALLQVVDTLRTLLQSIESTSSEGDFQCADLLAEIGRLRSVCLRHAPAADQEQGVDLQGPQSAQDNSLQPASGSGSPCGAKSVDAPAGPPPLQGLEDLTMNPQSAEPAASRLGSILVARGAVSEADVQRALQVQRAGDARPLGEILVSLGLARPTDIADGLQVQAETRAGLTDSTIRVDVALLDKLMNLVGELVLARNQVLQYTASQETCALHATSQRLNLITTELQEGVMKTRMQPIGNVWSKFPRVVRDLALACGKQVRIEMEGKETELDKTIIEAIKAPLTHIVRNSVDHGIEPPKIRVASGKPAEARLFLRAFHEGGQVNIEITDDGRGIEPEKMKAKALQQGLLTPDQASALSDRELVNLAFLPGFSTAEKVTTISGRGVGMDVVKTNIEKIGGTVDLQSRVGQGTTLKIKIPLTLAIIPALIVTSAGDRYAIPQVNLVELVRLEGEQARRGAEMIHGAPVYRLRGNLLPLVYLDRILKLDNPSSRAAVAETVNIVVLQADDRTFGLVVDEVNDTEEIVVKPLGKQLKGTSAFAGATIMGDGRVALILDALGLGQHANMVSASRDYTLSEAAKNDTTDVSTAQNLLVFGVGASGRAAVPLSSVARLEEFPASSVEQTEGLEVVQYRGAIMPLVRLSRYLHSEQGDQPQQSTLPVVVYSKGDQSVGLVVDRILDIVEESLIVQKRERAGCIWATAVIHQRVTDLLDVETLIRLAQIDLARHASPSRAEA